MNFGLDERERAWRDEVRTFVESLGAADVLGFRREMAALEVERHAPSFYRLLCARGWVGLGWPQPYGRPVSETERFVFHEEVDTAGLPMYGVEINEAIGWMLVRHGSQALRDEHLPRIVRGDTWYAGGYSEPEAGSDLLALTTRAELDGDVLRVSGSKLWTSSAHLADYVFAIVRTDASATRHRGLSIVLIDTRLPGVEITPVPVMGGWRVNLCFFDGVRVPVTNVVGELHQGWSVLAEALDVERAMSFGGREGRLWLGRLLHRYAGRADELGDARLEELGRFVMELEVERLLGLRLAAIGERGAIASAEASMAKVFGSELAQHLAQWATDVLAPESLYRAERGAADVPDHLAADMEEMLRVTTVYSVIGGTSEVQRNTVAQRGLGLPRG
ncbi:MAG TPA: acyl-CoA dehydrogenase family protein [Gaiellaceae bacterium]